MDSTLWISLASFAIFGALGFWSVFREVSPEKLKELNNSGNWFKRKIAKTFLLPSQKIHAIIGEAIEKGNVWGAFRFSAGMAFLFVYYFVADLFVYLVRWGIYAASGYLSPNFFEGFSLLFGAGLAALIRFQRISKKKLEEAKAKGTKKGHKQEEHRTPKERIERAKQNVVNKAKSKAKKYSVGLQSWIVIFGMVVWYFGELGFLALSPEYSIFLKYYAVIGAVVLFAYIIYYSFHNTPKWYKIGRD